MTWPGHMSWSLGHKTVRPYERLNRDKEKRKVEQLKARKKQC